MNSVSTTSAALQYPSLPESAAESAVGPATLAAAIRQDDAKRALALLEADPNLLVQPLLLTEFQDTPLSFCARLSRLHVLRAVLSHATLAVTARAAVNLAKESDGASPLYVAAQDGHLDVCQYLVAHKAEVNQCNDFGTAPLFMACQNGHLPVAQWLVAVGAEVDHADDDGSTALHIACQNGHLEVVSWLVQQGGADVNKAEEGGWTALHISCQHDNLDLVRWLVEAGGANIQSASFLSLPSASLPSFQGDPLYTAARLGHLSTVQYLAERGARLADVASSVWQHPSVLASLAQGAQVRLRRALLPRLATELACVWVPSELWNLVVEYALPIEDLDQLVEALGHIIYS
eukprot:gb/GEZN01010719.1/.p1 GENE.gb/GEZN01010719.1/~~gb/GEZN01010719.1/.p1  ORF type:complete len:348 (-),score=67.13 gb/GEZN01010719.1/:52-1095(-)